jgi:AcrR family transcriptional regulator
VLKLLADRSLDSLSLREIAREAGITPTAFYRHYHDVEELGLALVEESCRSLGRTMQIAGTHLTSSEGAVERSLGVMVGYRDDHMSHLRFIVRERDGGLRRVRRAIAGRLHLMADEVAVGLADGPGRAGWSLQDRRALAGLITETFMRMLADLLVADPDDETDIVERTRRRLRVIGVGGTAPGDAAHSGDGAEPLDGR